MTINVTFTKAILDAMPEQESNLAGIVANTKRHLKVGEGIQVKAVFDALTTLIQDGYVQHNFYSGLYHKAADRNQQPRPAVS